MTGLEVAAVVIGTVVGLTLGSYTTRRQSTTQAVGLASGEQQHQIDALMGQQRRWVIAALDRLADGGLIEDSQRRQGHCFVDIADGVDRSSERLAAHRELMMLWTLVATSRANHIDGRLSEAVRESQELAVLQAQIDQLGRASRPHRKPDTARWPVLASANQQSAVPSTGDSL